jgi:cell division protein FtsI/penicillin-binding protein 2
MEPGAAMNRRRKSREKVSRHGPAFSENQRVRGWFLLVCFFLVFAVIGIRLCQLHLTPGLRLTEEEREHIGWKELREPRGDIFDRNGLLLATDRKVPSLWADPRYVRDPQKLALVISARLGEEEEVVMERLCARDSAGNPRKFVWLKRWLIDVPEKVIDDVVDAGGGGVFTRYENLRYYPQGDTASHLLGFVNRNGQASEGLELNFNRHLQSIPGKHRARKDVDTKLLLSLTLEYREPEGGEMVQLTLDSDLQHTLEDALDRRMAECNAPRAMGLLMDPNSGAILAMASRPAFDPNHYSDYPAALRKNRALIDVFEPGSSFKIVTAAAALEQGLVTPDTVIDCENGRYNPFGRRVIGDFHPLEEEPFAICFAESSNIAMVKLAMKLGEERMDTWIRRFGFGVETSRDFPHESAGIYRPRSAWSGYTITSLPIGQEIAVTMPQLARAFAMIANGGYLVEPYFVERAVARSGEITWQHEAKPSQRILSPSTVRIMRDLCHRVVLYGTGQLAGIPEYRVGGKTGTAEIARRDGAGYDEERYTAVFAGFAPVCDPRIVGVIVVQEPMIERHYGGYVCGPVFREVVREALIRMNVPPDPVVEDTGSPEDDALLAENLAEDIGSIREEPEEQAAEMEPETAPADKPDDDIPRLPDFRGMNKRQALAAISELDIPWDPRGAGWVVAQEPPPWTPLAEVALCSLKFSSRGEAGGTENETTGTF